MEYFRDTRSAMQTTQGFLYGGIGGIACGAAMGATGLGGSLIQPLALFYGMQVGLFQVALHSEEGNRRRTVDVDPGKWLGALVASSSGAALAALTLPPASGKGRAFLALTAIGFGSITTYSHVIHLKDFAIGELNSGTLATDSAAVAITTAVNAAILRYSCPSPSQILHASSRWMAGVRGAVLLTVPLLTVDGLERLLQRS